MKKVKVLVVLLISILLLTGCFKRDKLESINIYTTTYPIEYLITSIYGYNSNISSIYPTNTNIQDFNLTNKQINDYSKAQMFVYSGLTNEKKIAASFLNKNKNIKLIDATKGITIQYKDSELWLSPANYLMLAQNIKKALNEYIVSSIVQSEINDNYEKIKLEISKYDSALLNISLNAKDKTIIVGNDALKFLEKYDFKVLSVDDSDNFSQADYQLAKNAIVDKTNSYVFILDTDTENEYINELKNNGAEIIKINNIDNLTENEKKENYNYPKMMNEMIEVIKNEVYN